FPVEDEREHREDKGEFRDAGSEGGEFPQENLSPENQNERHRRERGEAREERKKAGDRVLHTVHLRWEATAGDVSKASRRTSTICPLKIPVRRMRAAAATRGRR